MQLGNPSGATADPNNHDHYLIQRPVEAIDYSDQSGPAQLGELGFDFGGCRLERALLELLHRHEPAAGLLLGARRPYQPFQRFRL